MFPKPYFSQVRSAGCDQKTAGEAARRVLGALAEVQNRQSGYHARAAEVNAQRQHQHWRRWNGRPVRVVERRLLCEGHGPAELRAYGSRRSVGAVHVDGQRLAGRVGCPEKCHHIVGNVGGDYDQIVREQRQQNRDQTVEMDQARAGKRIRIVMHIIGLIYREFVGKK